MKVLVAASFPEIQSGVCAQAVETVRDLLADDAEIVSIESINWNDLRAVAASFSAVYVSVMQEFDLLIVIETAARGLGRGVYTMAETMQNTEKPVAVLRLGELHECRVEEWKTSDMKARYGRCVTEADDDNRSAGEDAEAQDEIWDDPAFENC